jgi:hypothetical protein
MSPEPSGGSVSSAASIAPVLSVNHGIAVAHETQDRPRECGHGNEDQEARKAVANAEPEACDDTDGQNDSVKTESPHGHITGG